MNWNRVMKSTYESPWSDEKDRERLNQDVAYRLGLPSDGPGAYEWNQGDPRVHPVTRFEYDGTAESEFYPYDLYHKAPTKDRHRIQTYGLIPSDPTRGNFAEELRFHDDEGLPEGIYASPDLKFVESYAKDTLRMSDIWKIPADTIPFEHVRTDTIVWENCVYVTQRVDNPILEIPFEDSQYAVKYWPDGDPAKSAWQQRLVDKLTG